MQERRFVATEREAKGLHDGSITAVVRVVKGYQIPEKTDSDDPKLRWMAVAQHHARYGFSVFGATQAECAAELSAFGKHPYCGRLERLWVREALHNEDGDWHYVGSPSPMWTDITDEWERKWISKGFVPACQMPRKASRTLLEVVDVKALRVKEISTADIRAIGLTGQSLGLQWIDLWNSINEKRGHGWDANEYVWFAEVKRVEE